MPTPNIYTYIHMQYTFFKYLLVYIYKHNIIFLSIYMHVFVFIYKQYTHLYNACTKTFILDGINRD